MCVGVISILWNKIKKGVRYCIGKIEKVKIMERTQSTLDTVMRGLKDLVSPSCTCNTELSCIEKPYTAFEEACLNLHNQYRALHGVEPLEWCDRLAKTAAKHAKIIAKMAILCHGDTNDGENLMQVNDEHLDPFFIVNRWYSESKFFDFNSPKFSKKTMGFTQIIWASTKKFAIAYSKGIDGLYYVVARYYPTGNYIERFQENINPVIDSSTITEDSSLLDTTTSIIQLNRFDTGYCCFKCEVLRYHNQIRESLNLPFIVWNDYLAEYAAYRAEALFYSQSALQKLPFVNDQITIVLNGGTPNITMVLDGVYYNYNSNLRNLSNCAYYQKFNPIFHYQINRMGCALMHDGENRLVCFLVYAPGTKMRVNIKADLVYI